MTQQSLKTTIYNAILEDILSYEYKPMEILNEKALVERYGCSKTPVREALISLCNDNVLRSIPRYGYEILRVTMEDVKDMLEYRYILESGLLTANYMKFNELHMKRLSDINAKCSEAKEDIWEHWQYNSDFHIMMVSFCNNNYAVEQLQKCMSQLKRAYAQFYWGNQEAIGTMIFDTHNHKNILDAIKDGDLDRILKSLKDDLKDFAGQNISW